MDERPPAKLIEAALGCLTDYGVAKTSLTDVARRAGVSRTTAYRCLGSKQEMLSAVARTEVERYLAALEGTLTPGSEAAVAMRDGVAFTLGYLRDHALIQRIFRQEPEEVIELVVERSGSPEIVTILTEATAGLIARWVEPGELRLPIDEAAEWIVRAVYSFLLMPSSRIDDPERVAALLLRGIAARPSPDAPSTGARY